MLCEINSAIPANSFFYEQELAFLKNSIQLFILNLTNIMTLYFVQKDHVLKIIAVDSVYL